MLTLLLASLSMNQFTAATHSHTEQTCTYVFEDISLPQKFISEIVFSQKLAVKRVSPPVTRIE